MPSTHCCTLRLQAPVLKICIKAAAALTALAWPLLIFAALKFELWTELLCLIALMMALRFVLTSKRSALGRLTAAGALIALALTGLSLFFKSHELMLWYPLAVNLLMLCAFALSLKGRMSLVEQLARIKEPDLDAAGVRYTRQVTKAWCIFFVVNGSLAAATALSGSLELWTLWNGLLSYLAMGLMFAGEYLIRLKVRGRNKKSEAL